MQAVETRKLVAHEKLLIDVIKRQAGTLKKAILEGTMNSVEAGATRIHINFLAERSKDTNNPSPAFLSIKDDGIGIQTKTELINHFETFGQPHESTENVIWKQFRMGRGQMFAFGKNTWRTSTYKMIVDVNEMELDYLFEDGCEFVDGCNIDIELYKNPLDNWVISSVKSLKEEVKEQVRFVKTPVEFNNEVVSVDPATLNWDCEDEFAYYKFTDTSSLKIYNLGVYVMSKSLKEVGVGGIIVSKQMLKVNFARNDIQDICPIFQAINKVVSKNKIKRANKSYRALSQDERFNLLCEFRDARQHYQRLESKRIFKTAQGKWISWSMIVKDGRPWCFAPEGSRIADRAMQMGVALCFDENMPDELGYTGVSNKFFSWLWSDFIKKDTYTGHKEKEIDNLENNFLMFDGQEEISDGYNFSKLKDMFNEDYRYIPYSELKNSEKAFIDSMNHLRCWEDRDIKIGVSNVANAWTDGSSFIAFERSFISGLDLTRTSSLLRLFTVGCHELAHDRDTAGTHNHGPEFYEKYYEITRKNYYVNPLYFISKFAKSMKTKKIENKRAKEIEKEKALKEKLGLVV